MDFVHLNDKKQESTKSCLPGFYQLMQMLYSSVGRCIRETGHAIFLQSNTFHFHKALFTIFCFYVKIKSGIPESRLGFNKHGIKPAFLQPLLHCSIGCLGIHVNDAPILFHCYQIITGASFLSRTFLAFLRIIPCTLLRIFTCIFLYIFYVTFFSGFFQINHCIFHQKFLASPGVFYMHFFYYAIHVHIGDEPIGT